MSFVARAARSGGPTTRASGWRGVVAGRVRTTIGRTGGGQGCRSSGRRRRSCRLAPGAQRRSEGVQPGRWRVRGRGSGRSGRMAPRARPCRSDRSGGPGYPCPGRGGQPPGRCPARQRSTRTQRTRGDARPSRYRLRGSDPWCPEGKSSDERRRVRVVGVESATTETRREIGSVRQRGCSSRRTTTPVLRRRGRGQRPGRGRRRSGRHRSAFLSQTASRAHCRNGPAARRRSTGSLARRHGAADGRSQRRPQGPP